MKYLFIAIAVFGLGAGTFLGIRNIDQDKVVLTEARGEAQSPTTTRAEIPPATPISTPAKTQSLCIDLLRLQTQLPISRYSLTSRENGIGIARDQKDRFALYPLTQGLNVSKELPNLKEAFAINNGTWKVYQDLGPEPSEREPGWASSYVVQAPLPFIVRGLDATVTSADVEVLIEGLSPVIKCEPKDVVYRKEVSSLDSWMSTLSSSQKAGLESAYAAGSAPYRSSLSLELHAAAPLCSMYRTEAVVATLSGPQRLGLLALYNAQYISAAQSKETDFFAVSSGSGSSPAGRYLGEIYLEKRLYTEFTKTAVLQADSRLGGTYFEVRPVSEADCNGLPR